MHDFIINIFNKVISKLKGNDFKIDPAIPISYLFSNFSGKLLNLIYGQMRLRSFKLCFISPSSKIKCSSRFKFGKNLQIDRHCFIDALSLEGITLGNNVSFGKYTHMMASGSLKYLGKGIKIGNNVGLGTHGHYGGAGGLEIGDDTIIGNFVSFHPEEHNYGKPGIPIRLQGTSHKGITNGKNCWIGAKATILDGTKVGDNCIIAAGALVKGEFPDNVIIGGVPAKILKRIIS